MMKNGRAKRNLQREALVPLEALLLAGLESGKPVAVTKEYLQQKCAALMQRLDKAVPKGS